MRARERVGPLLLLLLVGCNGEVVTLGRAGVAAGGSAAVAEDPKFAEPTLVAELAGDAKNDNPTLTADLLEIYFTSDRAGGAGDIDVWSARRSSAAEPFSEPTPVTTVNSDGFETSPAVGLGGLELWVGVERDGGLGEQDIWLSRRASRDDDWSELVNATELNSSEKDIPRQPAVDGKLMPLGSRRGSSGYYETFLAERPSEDAPFAEPRELTELEVRGQNSIDGFLSNDGLTLYFNRSPGSGESTGDLFVAKRPSHSEPFGDAVPLLTINTSYDERDPWLSPDEKQLFFSSDRDGTLSIYRALSSEP